MRKALGDFHISLGRIRALANHILADAVTGPPDPAVRDLHETQQCGAVVLLTGYFEAFLKDLVRRFVEELSRSRISFSSLPETIRNCHFENGGYVLAKATWAARKGRSAPFGSAPLKSIVERLHSTFSASGSYEILWEAFADTEANPRPDVVKRIAQNLDIKKNFWPSVSNHSGDPVRWSASALTTSLGDLINKRNECAHAGKVSPIPTPAEILEFADMLAALATGFVGVLEDHMRKLTTPQSVSTSQNSPPPPVPSTGSTGAGAPP